MGHFREGFIANRRSFPEAAACRLPFTTTQYGFFCPPSAAMSGYLRRPHTLKQTNEWLIAEAPPCSGSRRRQQGRSEDYPRPVLFHSVAGGSVACFLYAPTCAAAV